MDLTLGNSSLVVQNTTEKEFCLPLCDTIHDDLTIFGYCLTAINFFSVIVNIFHIFVLSQMDSLKGTPYSLILIHISICDIAVGIGTGLKLSLTYTEYFMDISKAGIIVYAVFVDFMVIGRYSIMAVACLERYYAICRPLQYSQSLYITKLNVWIPLLWMFSFILHAIRDGAFHNHMCFNARFGPINAGGLGPTMVTTIGIFIPLIISSIAVIKVCVELYRMNKRSMSCQEKQMKNATYYIIIIVLFFYACLVPPFAEYTAFILGSYAPLRVYINLYLCTTIYGIVNVIIYGFVTPVYRKQLLILLCGYPKRNPLTESSTV